MALDGNGQASKHTGWQTQLPLQSSSSREEAGIGDVSATVPHGSSSLQGRRTLIAPHEFTLPMAARHGSSLPLWFNKATHSGSKELSLKATLMVTVLPMFTLGE